MPRRKSAPLADPTWSESPGLCLWCGYSLAGLEAPGVCPECGAGFDADVLTLCGVPDDTAGAPTWRRLAWLAVIVAGILYFYIGWALLLILSPLLAGAAGLAIIAAIIALALTSPRERRGAERFVFTQRGVVRAPLKDGRRAAGSDSILIPYADADAIELKRVSPYWKKLRIGASSVEGRRLRGVVFRAGVRCPDEVEEKVRIHIEALMRRAPAAYETGV